MCLHNARCYAQTVLKSVTVSLVIKQLQISTPFFNFHSQPLRSDYQRISQELRDRGLKRPPPLRDEDPRRVGTSRPDTSLSVPTPQVRDDTVLSVLMVGVLSERQEREGKFLCFFRFALQCLMWSGRNLT